MKTSREALLSVIREITKNNVCLMRALKALSGKGRCRGEGHPVDAAYDRLFEVLASDISTESGECDVLKYILQNFTCSEAESLARCASQHGVSKNLDLMLLCMEEYIRKFWEGLEL